MAWCFSARALVATVLRMHTCISSCLWVNVKFKITPCSWGRMWNVLKIHQSVHPILRILILYFCHVLPEWMLTSVPIGTRYVCTLCIWYCDITYLQFQWEYMVCEPPCIANHYENQITNETITVMSHEGHGISHHQPLQCLLSSLLGLTSKKHHRPTLLALCEGNPPVTSRFTSQRASRVEGVSMSWRHLGLRPHICIREQETS